MSVYVYQTKLFLTTMSHPTSFLALLLLTGCLLEACRPKSTTNPASPAQPVSDKPGSYTQGRFLFDNCGNKITLRGVNKMSVWTDREGNSFAEIAKSGANCVRIVWLTKEDNGQPTSAANLDDLIAKCAAQNMIPMVEVHDATGDWSKLGDMVSFWKRSDILSVIKKHEKYLLINIANECGDDRVTDAQFSQGYTSAVQQLRQAGIRTPLVIDGADWGKNLEQLVRVGPGLIQADPNKNLLFSVHTYWPVAQGASPQFIKDQFEAAVKANLPFIVGEFAAYGAYAGNASICSAAGRVDYQTILSETQRLGIGWLAWEWGPGNAGGGDPLCSVMDMTTDGRFVNLVGWGKDLALTNTNGIQRTSSRPPSLVLCK